jgi:hypothetical protein
MHSYGKILDVMLMMLGGSRDRGREGVLPIFILMLS